MTVMDGSSLRDWRRSKGWDVPKLAREFRRAATETIAAHDALVRQIRGWERGAHELSERYELLYRRLGYVPPASAAPAPPEPAVLLDELASQAVEVGRWAETANAGPGTIAQLDDAIDRIASDYLSSPPGPPLHRARDVTTQVFGLLRQHQRLSVTRDLYVTGAKCCAFLAWAAGDLGHLDAATAHGRAALILAEEAGHPGAEALALRAVEDGFLGRAHQPREGPRPPRLRAVPAEHHPRAAGMPGIRRWPARRSPGGDPPRPRRLGVRHG
jgi:hypothetical protein